MEGHVFGRLTVVQLIEGSGRAVCKCECGQSTNVLLKDLKSGHTQSCGCLQRERARQYHLTHGASGTPEHSIWCGICARCSNPSHKQYADYGGRGIFVCARWSGENGFAHFLADMGPRPSSKHSVDRKDNNGPYSPDNCRWATQKEQNRNTRQNTVLRFNGAEMCVADWADATGISQSVIRRRLKLGWSVEKALKTQVGSSLKLNAVYVLQIRALASSGVPDSEIGRQFGVSSVMVGLIRRRRLWKHV
jgi:hypothetical protein